MLKLFGPAPSINVRKVLWTCTELRLEIEHVQWDDPLAEMKRPAFVALNPNAMVPVLQDGAFALWESNAICRYLVGRTGPSDLLPSVAEDRAIVEQWMDWQVAELNNAWRYAFLSLVRQSPAHRDPQAVDASIAAWNRHMAILDGQLARTEAFVTGAVFTLADVVLGLSACRWRMAPIPRPALPHVEAWLARLGERRGYRQHADGMP